MHKVILSVIFVFKKISLIPLVDSNSPEIIQIILFEKLSFFSKTCNIENTKLNTLLHIVQNKNNKDMKNYSSEDLVRLELVIIQELMKKNEELEKRIEKLERNDK